MKHPSTSIFIVDAFTSTPFSGNRAGVMLLGTDDFPSDPFMLSLAQELNCSETVFVKTLGATEFHMRYFTPAQEVDLCGHATVAGFSVLCELGIVGGTHCQLTTLAGTLTVTLDDGWVWMDMASPQLLRTFTPEECAALYAAYGLTPEDGVPNLPPQLVSTGLADILLPIKDSQTLDSATQNKEQVIACSQQYDAVGFHLFSLEEDCTARCRNFAPRYLIDEESATGTANGALSYYLYHHHRVPLDKENLFLQGACMGRPSQIKSRVTQREGAIQIKIGGTAVITLRCHRWVDAIHR